MNDLYASVDPIIEKWCEANSVSLLTSFAGREVRFFYRSSSRGECFQISIEPPEGDFITVHAWSIETLDDRELRQDWIIPNSGLQKTLDAALSKMCEWME